MNPYLLILGALATLSFAFASGKTISKAVTGDNNGTLDTLPDVKKSELSYNTSVYQDKARAVWDLLKRLNADNWAQIYTNAQRPYRQQLYDILFGGDTPIKTRNDYKMLVRKFGKNRFNSISGELGFEDAIRYAFNRMIYYAIFDRLKPFMQ